MKWSTFYVPPCRYSLSFCFQFWCGIITLPVVRKVNNYCCCLSVYFACSWYIYCGCRWSQAGVGEFVISAYQELAKQVSVALMHEERRCGYFTKQKLRMWALQDDTSSSPEGEMFGRRQIQFFFVKSGFQLFFLGSPWQWNLEVEWEACEGRLVEFMRNLRTMTMVYWVIFYVKIGRLDCASRVQTSTKVCNLNQKRSRIQIKIQVSMSTGLLRKILGIPVRY